MNFYDVYTTMTYIPEGEKALTEICTFLQCQNERETLKQALWRSSSRAENPGIFPFDAETGRIYDSLWKAAATENYSPVQKVARWILKTLCPPADDEGPESFLRKARPVGQGDDEDRPPPRPIVPERKDWEVSDEREETPVDVPAARPGAEPVKRRSKKTD
jgi:hypothetical protein